MRLPYRPFMLVLLLLLGAAVMVAVSLGSVRIPLPDLVDTLLGKAGAGSGYGVIIWGLRLPRIALAILVGAALSISGMVLQAIFRNPLADPYIVGISSGAAFGAALALGLGWVSVISGPDILPPAAFLGALATAALVYMLASREGRVAVYTLLLAGVAVSAFVSAMTSFVMVMSRREMQVIFFWIMGGFNAAAWRHVLTVLPYLLFGSLFIWSRGRDLNVLLLGDEQAQHLGLDVEKSRRLLLAVTSLLTAAAVSVSGIIGFVGLVVPHVARILIGPDHRRLLPASALLGALTLVLADTAARTLLTSSEIPVGLVTAVLGAPFFVYLLYRRKR